MRRTIPKQRSGVDAPKAQYSIRSHWDLYPRLAIALALLDVLPGPASAASSPGAALNQYLQARLRGDVAAAEALWDGTDVRRSQALGLSFAPAEAQFDDNLMLAREERSGVAARARFAVRDSIVDTRWARFRVSVEPAQPGLPDTLQYTLRKSGDGWVLVAPYAQLTRGWTEREGRYFRLRSSKLRHVNKQALEALDAQIQNMLDRLQTPELARLRLERMKLEYYLCADDTEVRALTGSSRPGQYRPAGARIVSRAPADLNAVARAVLHLTLRETPPHAVAFLEDGLAAALGGWGSSSAGVTAQRGGALLTSDVAVFDAALDAKALRGSAADRFAAVAAFCNEVLLSKLGAPRFLELYRSLSGTAAQVARPAQDVRAALEKATGKTGPALVEWFRQGARDLRPPLVGGCVTFPEESARFQPMVRWRDPQEQWSLEIYESGDEYLVAVGPYTKGLPRWAQQMMDSLAAASGETPETKAQAPSGSAARPPGDPPQIVILIRERLVLEPDAYESELFQSQFSRRRYAGDLLGLFVDPDGARLFDYRRDVLAGCHARDYVLPGTGEYYDTKSGRLCFRMRRDILPQPLTEYIAVSVLYTGE